MDHHQQNESLTDLLSLNHHLEDEYWSLFQSMPPLIPEVNPNPLIPFPHEKGSMTPSESLMGHLSHQQILSHQDQQQPVFDSQNKILNLASMALGNPSPHMGPAPMSHLHQSSPSLPKRNSSISLLGQPLETLPMRPLQLPPALPQSLTVNTAKAFPSPPKSTPQFVQNVTSPSTYLMDSTHQSPIPPHTPPLLPTLQSPGLNPIQQSPLMHPFTQSFSSQSHSHQDLKRERHKLSEKNRRLLAKNGYDTLMDLLPEKRKEQWSSSGKMPSRNAILHVTVEYIKELQSRERELEREIQRLRLGKGQ